MFENKGGISFVWKIENFSMLPHQLGEELVSPTFVLDMWEEVEFCLWLYPRGETDEKKLALYLCKEPEDLELKVSFTLAVESAEPSEEIIQLEKDHTLECGFGFPNLISISNIYAKTNHYLPQDTLTLRCEISPAEVTPAELKIDEDSKSNFTFYQKHCFSLTGIQVQKRSIMWSISNIKERIEKPEKAYILLTSFLENSPSLKLTLNFNKRSNGDDFPISINQTSIPTQAERLFVKCKITVTSNSVHKEYLASETSTHLFKNSTSDVWRFPPFLTTTRLADKKYLNGGDTLLLRCEFSFSNISGLYHSANNSMSCAFEAKRENSELSTCFANLYSSGRFCDVELKAGGKTFPYYKAVLCARSSVFSAMFENDMKEKDSNIVEIEDVDPDTLQRMLTYMHSDNLQEDLSSEDACSLYLVADKYDLVSLKKRCSALLATTVSLDNVCDLLVFSEAHLDNHLMSAVSDFVCSHTTEVFHSDQWNAFMEDNPKLSCHVMHKMWIGIDQI